MAKQTINIGASPNDGTGTPLRTAFDYTNQNFTELYTATGPSGNNIVVPGNATITGDLTVATNRLSVSSTGVQIGTTTNKTTAFTGNGTGLTIGAALAPTIALWDTTNASYVGSISQIDADMYLTNTAVGQMVFSTDNTSRYTISSTGIATWSNVGGVAGTAMTLNSTGLGVGDSPSYKLHVARTADGTVGYFRRIGATINPALTVYCNETGNTVGFGTDYAGAISPAITFTTAGTERLRIDTAGNVGIGVTPSGYRLHVRAAFASTVGGAFIESGEFNQKGLVVNCTSAALSANIVEFQREGTARLTLDASGNLLVGSALPVSGGRISGNSSTGPAGRFFSSAGDNQFAAMFDKSSATNTTSQFLIGFTINNQATGSGQINANGASQAAFGTFSDSRLKENIVSLPSQLANILSLRPVEFDYKDGSGHQIGFVAQEMQGVYSDTVSEQNGFLTVTGWSKTEARLVSAIKELAAKVQALEAKLA